MPAPLPHIQPFASRRPQGWPRVNPRHPQVTAVDALVGNERSLDLVFACWPLGGESFGTAYDVGVPGTHDATLNSGATVVADREMGTCMDFSAAGSYLEISKNGVTSPNSPFDQTDFTVMFWMRGTQNATGNALLIGCHDGNAPPTNGFTIFQNTANQAAFIGWTNAGGQTVNFNTGTTINDGVWHHIACLISQTNAVTNSIYLDGVLASSANNSGNWSGSNHTNPVRWALSTSATFGKFTGQITDTRWIAGWLSPQAIGQAADPRTRWAPYRQVKAPRRINTFATATHLVTASSAAIISAMSAENVASSVGATASAIISAASTVATSHTDIATASVIVSAAAAENATTSHAASASVVLTPFCSKAVVVSCLSIFRLYTDAESTVAWVSAAAARVLLGVSPEGSGGTLTVRRVAFSLLTMRCRADRPGVVSVVATDYIGRVQQGQSLPFRIQCLNRGALSLPATQPFVTIYGTGGAIAVLPLAVLAETQVVGRFGIDYLVGLDLPPGRYLALYQYGQNGLITAEAHNFEVVPGGDAQGSVIASQWLRGAGGEVLLSQLESGKLLFAQSPYLSEGV